MPVGRRHVDTPDERAHPEISDADGGDEHDDEPAFGAPRVHDRSMMATSKRGAESPSLPTRQPDSRQRADDTLVHPRLTEVGTGASPLICPHHP